MESLGLEVWNVWEVWEVWGCASRVCCLLFVVPLRGFKIYDLRFGRLGFGRLGGLERLAFGFSQRDKKKHSICTIFPHIIIFIMLSQDYIVFSYKFTPN